MKHVFIINPKAGKTDRTAEIKALIDAYARERGADCRVLVTGYPRHAAELVRDLTREYPDEPLRFYACGGDGTLNEVLDGMAGREGAALTHYPVGTGNDFIRIFGGQAAFSELRELIEGREEPVDYIRTDSGAALNIVSVGLDARIAAGMGKYKKVPLLRGQGPYLLSTAEQLVRGIGSSFSVEVDGERLDGRYTLILAANGQYYGGGFHPVPDADCRDGVMEVLLIREVSLMTAARVIGAYKQGRYRELPQYVLHRRARTLRVSPPDGKPLVVNLDGETLERPELKAELVPGGTRFILPRGTEPMGAGGAE